MFWKITHDLIRNPDEASDVGTGNGERAKGVKVYTFRLYDDDGEHYYTGICDKEAFDIDDETPAGLYTAYKWGEWNAGTTDLRIRLKDVEAMIGEESPTYRRIVRKDGWCSIYG